METGAVVAITVQVADAGDTQTLEETLAHASDNLELVAELIENEPRTAAVDVEARPSWSPTRGTTVERWCGRWPRRECAAIFRNPSVADNGGTDKAASKLRCMLTAGDCALSAQAITATAGRETGANDGTPI
jgi:hypothetical protein